jgi:hypothetical protein
MPYQYPLTLSSTKTQLRSTPLHRKLIIVCFYMVAIL